MEKAEPDDRAADRTNPQPASSEAESSLTDKDLEKVSGGVGGVRRGVRRATGPGTQTEDEPYID